MTGLLFRGMDDLPKSSERGSRRRAESAWRWQRGGAGSPFRLRLRVVHTEAERDAALRVREHLEYLKRMATEGVVPPALATRARNVWGVALVSVGGALPVPAAAAFTGGPVEYHWSAGPHQLTAEIPGEGPCHWTYRNRNTGELWGEETDEDGLPHRLIRALTRIAESSH